MYAKPVLYRFVAKWLRYSGKTAKAERTKQQSARIRIKSREQYYKNSAYLS